MCDLPSVYGVDHPQAKREHQCCECRGIIRVGEHYFKHHGIWDGSASTFKVCEDCTRLRGEVDKGITDLEEQTAFQHLCESVFDSGEPSIIGAFLTIKRNRNAAIAPWMIESEKKWSEQGQMSQEKRGNQ